MAIDLRELIGGNQALRTFRVIGVGYLMARLETALATVFSTLAGTPIVSL